MKKKQATDSKGPSGKANPHAIVVVFRHGTIQLSFFDLLNLTTKAAQFYVVLRKAIGMRVLRETLLNRAAATPHSAHNMSSLNWADHQFQSS